MLWRKLAGRTLFITGASRGIGKAIALKAAKDGANIVIAAKTAEAHPTLPGTIYTAAKEIENTGGKALPCIVDVRDESSVGKAVNEAVKNFGGIDIVVNNASAIALTGTQETQMKRFDLMHQINTRGTFLVSKLCIPHLQKSPNPHILNISPPLNMDPRWFKNHVGYTMAKYGMSMCVLGMAEELKPLGIACNALWPRTAIITAAMEMLGGKDVSVSCRKPDIVADAAYTILCKDSKSYTGNFAIDDDVLKAEGVTNFAEYAVDPSSSLIPDFFLDDFPEDIMKKIAGPKETIQPSSQESQPLSDSPLSKVFSEIASVIDEDMVSKIKAVYLFEVSGDETGQWFVDLKEGKGTCGPGKPSSAPDATLSMKGDVLLKMFQGKIKPTTAFMTGKLKISGDMGKALKLEKLMGKMHAKL